MSNEVIHTNSRDINYRNNKHKFIEKKGKRETN